MIDIPPPLKLWLPAKPAIIRAAKDIVPASFLPGMFPGIVGGAAALAPRSASFINSALSNSGATTYNFTGSSFGTAAVDRYIIGLAAAQGANAYSSATIGGVSAAKVFEVNGGSGSTGMNIVLVLALVPTGTSGTISVTWGGAQQRSAIGWWSANMPGISHVDANGGYIASGASQNATLATLADGFVLAAAMTNAPSMTWAPVTERFETGFGGSRVIGGADATTSGANVTPEVTYSSSTGAKVFLAASF